MRRDDRDWSAFGEQNESRAARALRSAGKHTICTSLPTISNYIWSESS